MRKSTGIILTLAAAAALCTAGIAQVASAEDSAAQATYRDIEQTLGSVPGFFKALSRGRHRRGLGGVQVGPAQSEDQTRRQDQGADRARGRGADPVPVLHLFPHRRRQGNGATDEEIREAVAMAAIVRHWSTVLNGMQVDLAGFKRETDTVLRVAAEKAKTAKSQ